MKLRTVLFVALCGAPGLALASTESFQHPLSLGMRGEDVRELQKVLNRDTETSIANTGAGSPGNETDYFGPATKRALIKFQEKFANEILAPAKLARGNGYVGVYTRVKLNALSALAVSGKSSSPSSALSPAPSSVTTSAPLVVSPSALATTTPASQNPNLKNIDLYINKIKQDGLKRGLSPRTLTLIEDKIRVGAATTTDFRKQFFDNQKAAYSKKVSENTPKSPTGELLWKAISFIEGIFSPQKANAALGLPFGGYIVFVDPLLCDCPPGITQIFVASANPNPLQSNLLLNYVDGSEGFLWHNIPEPGIATLGTYVPLVQSCWTWVVEACVPIPAEGQITPMVGSSQLPL